jgi:hypothetical protein
LGHKSLLNVIVVLANNWELFKITGLIYDVIIYLVREKVWTHLDFNFINQLCIQFMCLLKTIFLNLEDDVRYKFPLPSLILTITYEYASHLIFARPN